MKFNKLFYLTAFAISIVSFSNSVNAEQIKLKPIPLSIYGKISNMSGSTVTLVTEKGSVEVPRKSIKAKDMDIRPGKKVKAVVSWKEIYKAN